MGLVEAGKGGQSSCAAVSNCINEATVTLTGKGLWQDGVGGLIGLLSYTGGNNNQTNKITLSKLINKGNVTSTSSPAGGIAGYLGFSTSLFECENYGSITGDGDAGGLAGRADSATNQWHSGKLEKLLNAGDITGNIAGGIVGYAHLTMPATGCINAGKANGSYTSNPIIASINQNAVITFSDCYYLDDSGTTATIAGITPKTLPELEKLDGITETFLEALDKLTTIPDEYADYTIIESAEDFEQIRNASGGNYYLSQHIVLPENYEPISNFTGTLVGAERVNLRSITMHINKSDVGKNEGVGLFKNISGNAVIKNLKLKGSIKATGDLPFVGALAGYVTGDNNVTNCLNEAEISIGGTSYGSSVGGFFGGMVNGNVSGTYFKLINKGNITATTSIYAGGGILGRGANGGLAVLSECENYGSISSDNNAAYRIELAGGIVGEAFAGTRLKTEKCYNAGSVSGDSAGGIAGRLRTNALIEKCYNTGDVVAGYSGAVTGGLFALVNGSETGVQVKDSYNAGKVRGKWNDSPVAGMASTLATLTNCGYLSTTAYDDGIEGTTPMTLAQLKALENAPEAFLRALDFISVE